MYLGVRNSLFFEYFVTYRKSAIKIEDLRTLNIKVLNEIVWIFQVIFE